MRRYRKPFRVKKKKSIIKSRFFWLSLLIVIFFGGLFYFLVFSSVFQISEIKISGSQKIQPQNLEDFIENRIKQKWLGFFETKNIFFADLNKTKEELMKNFPQISKIELERKLPNGLIFRVEERKPAAIFSQNENYFFIDKEGIIFEKAFLADDFPKLQSLTLQDAPELGGVVIDKNLLSKILEADFKLKKDFNVAIKEVSIISDNRLNATTSEMWAIYFNQKENLDWQITKLQLVLEKQVLPEKRGNLEYIDLIASTANIALTVQWEDRSNPFSLSTEDGTLTNVRFADYIGITDDKKVRSLQVTVSNTTENDGLKRIIVYYDFVE